VERAIDSFVPHKSPGMDGIFPALQQEGWEVLIPYLVRIFRACLVTGYVPAMWHQVKVVFIPKPGRNSYCGSEDFRPISLTSLLLKTMERLVDRFLRDEILAFKQLHPNQHAYQAGKSVEIALHQLVLRVEKALDQQEIALGVFHDIEGEFNNTSYDSMCAALARHGADYITIRWIRAILEGSQIRYQGSYNGPFMPSQRGVTSSVCRLIPTKLGLLHSLKEGNSQGSSSLVYLG